MSKTTTIHFTQKQIEYLIKKTGADNADEAAEIFIVMMNEERIDPSKMTVYLDKIMEKDRVD